MTPKAARRRHAEHISHEAWAIPYADLITLLLAFFVMMYAISSVNDGKYRVLADSLSVAFGADSQNSRIIPAGDLLSADASVAPIARPIPLVDLPRPAIVPSREAIEVLEHAQRQKEAMQQDRLGALANELDNSLSGLTESGDITVRRNPLFLEVEMRTDVLFVSGSAELQMPAADVVRRIAETLAPFPNPVKVEGHTDDQPIASTQYPSNWELSAARAASVVKRFVDAGVAPTRVAVVGYGSERPKASNATLDGRNTNRRVVLVVLAEPEIDEIDDVPSSPSTRGPLPTAPLASRSSVPAPALSGGHP